MKPGIAMKDYRQVAMELLNEHHTDMALAARERLASRLGRRAKEEVIQVMQDARWEHRLVPGEERYPLLQQIQAASEEIALSQIVEQLLPVEDPEF